MTTRTLRSGIFMLMVPALLWGGVAASAASPAPARPEAAAAQMVPHSGNQPPHIVPQATGLTGRRYPREANRNVPYAAYSDGCNHDYGTPEQCIPLHSPASFQGSNNKAFDCAYLTVEGFFTKPLLVRNDSLKVLARHRSANKAIQTTAGWFLTGCVDG